MRDVHAPSFCPIIFLARRCLVAGWVVSHLEEAEDKGEESCGLVAPPRARGRTEDGQRLSFP